MWSCMQTVVLLLRHFCCVFTYIVVHLLAYTSNTAVVLKYTSSELWYLCRPVFVDLSFSSVFQEKCCIVALCSVMPLRLIPTSHKIIQWAHQTCTHTCICTFALFRRVWASPTCFTLCRSSVYMLFLCVLALVYLVYKTCIFYPTSPSWVYDINIIT